MDLGILIRFQQWRGGCGIVRVLGLGSSVQVWRSRRLASCRGRRVADPPGAVLLQVPGKPLHLHQLNEKNGCST